MSRHFKVLLIEDDEDDFVLIKELMREIGSFEFDLDWVETYDSGVEAIYRAEHDVVLLDYRPGERNGLELLREVVANGCLAPIILLTAHGDYRVDNEAMDAGAADYLTKGQINSDLLEHSIRYSISRKRAELELKNYRDHLEKLLNERTEQLESVNRDLRMLNSEHKRAEDELLLSQNFSQNILETTPHLIYIYDLQENRNIYASPGMIHILGYSPLEVLDQGEQLLANILHPDDFTKVGAHHARLASTPDDNVLELEYRMRHVKGHWIILRSRDKVFSRDEQGRVKHIIGTAEDITERKRAEEALQESEEHFATVFRASPIGTSITRLSDGRFLDVNDAFLRLFGYEREEVIGKNPLILNMWVNPEDRALMVQGLHEKGRTEGFETTFRTKSGVIRNVMVVAELFEVAGEQCILGLTLDITRRKQAEESLIEIHRQNQLILDAAGEGILGVDKRGKVTFANPAALEMVGYEAEELIGNSLHELIHHHKPDGSSYPITECPMNEALSAGISSNIQEELLWRKEGTSFPSAYSTRPIIEHGKITGAVVTFRDITERKQAEEERKLVDAKLRQAQKMEAIGTLAGGIAHDFNNILSAIIGFTELSLSKTSEDSPLRSYLGEVLDAGTRATDLVEQILTFSRETETEPKPVWVASIVKEALRLLRASIPTTIEIRREITASPQCTVLADPTQIHQVIMNLCTNAAHAMREEGGVLEVELTETVFNKGDQRSPPQLGPGHYLCLMVGDTGCGMNEDTKLRIFDPFFTTKPRGEGTGMGLAVVHGIVETYGGAISVESKIGQGSRFHVYFPVTVAAAQGNVPEPKEAPAGNGRILFVDDEQALVRMGRVMLENLGYSVLGVTSSMEALEVFKSQPDRFDLVVTDYTMPGMTGVELATEIRKIRAETPVLLCTGYGELLNGKDIAEFGIRELLHKPISRSALAQAIKRILE